MTLNHGSKHVTIIILNYNGFKDTIACIDNLLNITFLNYRIVVVDNCSPDSSVKRICRYLQISSPDFLYVNSPEKAMLYQDKVPQVVVIQTGFNGGYGYGNNIGIKFALKLNTDYMLILNNDTIVEQDFLEPLITFCEKNNDIGVASGKIYYYNNKDTYWFNGGKFNKYTAKITHINYNEKDIGQETPKINTFITGCFWFIPKRVIESVGLINENYFMYLEDLEYCQRVIEKGFRLAVCQESKIYHKVSSSTGGHLSPFSVYWSAKNKYKYIKSSLNFFQTTIAFFYLIFLHPLRMIKNKKIYLIMHHYKGIFDEIRS